MSVFQLAVKKISILLWIFLNFSHDPVSVVWIVRGLEIMVIMWTELGAKMDQVHVVESLNPLITDSHQSNLSCSVTRPGP